MSKGPLPTKHRLQAGEPQLFTVGMPIPTAKAVPGAPQWRVHPLSRPR